MRLDAMLGKSIVGIEKKIKEPTWQEARENIPRQKGRKPYKIPAIILMKHNKLKDNNSTEK